MDPPAQLKPNGELGRPGIGYYDYSTPQTSRPPQVDSAGSARLDDLINRCLDPDPTQRPTSAQLRKETRKFVEAWKRLSRDTGTPLGNLSIVADNQYPIGSKKPQGEADDPFVPPPSDGNARQRMTFSPDANGLVWGPDALLHFDGGDVVVDENGNPISTREEYRLYALREGWDWPPDNE